MRDRTITSNKKKESEERYCIMQRTIKPLDLEKKINKMMELQRNTQIAAYAALLEEVLKKMML